MEESSNALVNNESYTRDKPLVLYLYDYRLIENGDCTYEQLMDLDKLKDDLKAKITPKPIDGTRPPTYPDTEHLLAYTQRLIKYITSAEEVQKMTESMEEGTFIVYFIEGDPVQQYTPTYSADKYHNFEKLIKTEGLRDLPNEISRKTMIEWYNSHKEQESRNKITQILQDCPPRRMDNEEVTSFIQRSTWAKVLGSVNAMTKHFEKTNPIVQSYNERKKGSYNQMYKSNSIIPQLMNLGVFNELEENGTMNPMPPDGIYFTKFLNESNIPRYEIIAILNGEVISFNYKLRTGHTKLSGLIEMLNQDTQYINVIEQLEENFKLAIQASKKQQ